ncbi:MAG TPA: hypothetical protein PKL52_03900 [Tenuifilaceae bacterium]|nr:hypothetical protein [Tenuifilaceae bacterium]
MKKLILFGLTLVLVTLGINSFSQSLRNKEVALIAFNCNVNQAILQLLDEFSQDFPEVENPKCNKYMNAIKMNSWSMIEDMLRAEFNIYMLPLNTFGKSFSYDQYGFPDVNINRALRQGASRFYLKADLIFTQIAKPIEIGASSRTNKENGDDEEEADPNSFTPEVTITLTFYTNKGIIPLQKVTGIAQASTPWNVSDELLNGLVNDERYDTEPAKSIMGLFRQAMKDVFKNFPLQR